MAQQSLTLELLDETIQVSLYELCDDCGIHAEFVMELVEHGVLQPKGASPGDWSFAGNDLMRIRKAMRLQRDLGLNLPGLALALELLDEIRELRQMVASLGPQPD